MSAIPLWGPHNLTIYSDVFVVAPGKVCVLFAAGFEEERVRVTNAEFVAAQSCCVRRLRHQHGLEWCCGNACDWIAHATDASVVADELVSVCGKCWEMSLGDNLRVIGIPGTYRLELNDATAIGVLQVWAEQYDVAAIPSAVAHLFF